MSLDSTVAIDQAVKNLQNISSAAPVAAIVLGSGVEAFNDLQNSHKYSYQEIFGIAPSIKGHSGTLEVGLLNDKLIAVLRGRFHLYEGHSFATVTLPTNSLAKWGVSNLYLTNAAGGLNPALEVGDLMLITGYRDHLGPQWNDLGALPAITAPTINCENELLERLWSAAQGSSKLAAGLKRGVYTGVLGPCYETLAEVEMLIKLGSDAVGMSTIPELQAASKTNMRACAISVITNSWASAKIHGHLEVLAAAKAASANLDELLKTVILS